MVIAILNAYDARNLGDQAIVHCQIAWCRQSFPGCRVLVFSHHHETNRQVFGEDSRPAIFRLPPAAGAYRRLAAPIRDLAGYLAHPRWWRDQAADFLSADLYLMCGGGYLYSSAAPLLSRNLCLACLQGIVAARTGRPLVLFPQSIGPLTKRLDQIAVRALCTRAALIMPRSTQSLAPLQQWGLTGKSVVVPDIVLAMRHLCPDLYPSPGRRSGLGIAPVNYSFVPALRQQAPGPLLDRLALTGAAFHRRTGEPVRLFVQVNLSGSDDDAGMAGWLRDRLTGMGVPTELTDGHNVHLSEYLARVEQCRVFIGARMHACLFALTSHVPTIGISYQPKFKGTFELLGLDDWVQPIAAATADWLSDRLHQALHQEDQWRQDLQCRVDQATVAILRELSRVVKLAPTARGPGRAGPKPASGPERAAPATGWPPS